VTRLRVVGLSLATVGLILKDGGLVLGSTERIVIERYSWEAERSIVFQPDSYVAIRFNGTRSYTYWRRFWQPEVRSTWSWDHWCKWNVTIRSGHMLTYRLFNERAFKGWVNHDPEYDSIKFEPTGSFEATDTPGCEFRWWVEDPGNPCVVLLSNSTAPVTVEFSVGEKWFQFKNQNVHDGAVLVGPGLAVSVTGVVVFLRKRQPKSDVPAH